jgi:predicted dehydrogenase
MKQFFSLYLVSLIFLWAIPTPSSAQNLMRIGIVGCDTSHVVAFTKLINDPAAKGLLAKFEVTCAYPGGSPDIPSSGDRVEGFTEELRGAGVEIVDSPRAVAEKSDAILLESIDGRVHLEQFRQIAVGKPVFIDKPAAASLVDLMAIFKLAGETKTPCFTSSALRFSDKVVALKNNVAIGEINGCSVASPFQTEPHHPDLFWYGVHGVETVYALMGAGCERVSRVDAGQATVVVGAWGDGRFATYQGLKGHADYAFTAFGSKGIACDRGFSGYAPLVNEICEFFVSRKAPVSSEETIEMFAFMEAADESLRQDGRPVLIKDIIIRAKLQLDSGGADND